MVPNFKRIAASLIYCQCAMIFYFALIILNEIKQDFLYNVKNICLCQFSKVKKSAEL